MLVGSPISGHLPGEIVEVVEELACAASVSVCAFFAVGPRGNSDESEKTDFARIQNTESKKPHGNVYFEGYRRTKRGKKSILKLLLLLLREFLRIQDTFVGVMLIAIVENLTQPRRD